MDYGVQYNKHVVLALYNELHLMKNKKGKLFMCVSLASVSSKHS